MAVMHPTTATHYHYLHIDILLTNYSAGRLNFLNCAAGRTTYQASYSIKYGGLGKNYA
jgi:hypothetical protein